MNPYQPHFSLAMNNYPEGGHFAAHSHHFWPDVTRKAMTDYWDDANLLTDKKWEKIFGSIIPSVQQFIASELKTNAPEMIAFAPSTHDFVIRLFSCFEPTRKLNILTTDSEFHSFSRQSKRLEELSNFHFTRIPTEPFSTFPERFKQAIHSDAFDIIFFSHVFYNSGYKIPDLHDIINEIPEGPMIVVDGYHAWFAVPVDLSTLHHRIFYMSGGYKYAMSGEGICFLTVPQHNKYRPISTGWFSTFGNLTAPQKNQISYSDDGFKFWGATFDPSGLYRFHSVSDLFSSNHWTISQTDDYIQHLMTLFLEGIKNNSGNTIQLNSLITPTTSHGHFFTFEIQDAKTFHEWLLTKYIYTDYRGNRIRFGFGIYQDEKGVERLLRILKEK